uniref:Uncharacterized protein n=1 Tax=Arundo donax TaxID=35708 RepID=A0A0A9GA33_ARUDO
MAVYLQQDVLCSSVQNP